MTIKEYVKRVMEENNRRLLSRMNAVYTNKINSIIIDFNNKLEEAINETVINTVNDLKEYVTEQINNIPEPSTLTNEDVINIVNEILEDYDIRLKTAAEKTGWVTENGQSIKFADGLLFKPKQIIEENE